MISIKGADAHLQLVMAVAVARKSLNFLEVGTINLGRENGVQ
jgi:hypothetical protein